MLCGRAARERCWLRCCVCMYGIFGESTLINVYLEMNHSTLQRGILGGGGRCVRVNMVTYIIFLRQWASPRG